MDLHIRKIREGSYFPALLATPRASATSVCFQPFCTNSQARSRRASCHTLDCSASVLLMSRLSHQHACMIGNPFTIQQETLNQETLNPEQVPDFRRLLLQGVKCRWAVNEVL